MNSKVDFFFEKPSQWQEAFKKLRLILLDCELEEELKWGKSCYTFQGNNVVLMHGFKEYCALLFHKGALLKDSNGLLIQQTENVQAARQIRFTRVEEVAELAATIKAYVYEAVEVDRAGLKVEMKETRAYRVPEELRQAFDENPTFKTAFKALTPGRQRGYLLHFSQPKQAKTRVSRIEQSMPNVLAGKGWNER